MKFYIVRDHPFHGEYNYSLTNFLPTVYYYLPSSKSIWSFMFYPNNGVAYHQHLKHQDIMYYFGVDPDSIPHGTCYDLTEKKLIEYTELGEFK